MLTLLQPPRYITFSDTETYIKLQTDLPTNTVNLRARVEIQSSTGAILDVHDVSFHPVTRIAVIDIKSAFQNIAPPLPPDGALDTATAPYINLPDSVLSYRIKYFEKYGIPTLAQTPQYSDYYTALYGSHTADALLPTSNYGNDVHFLHDYPTGYRKTVTQFQPDFFYLFSREFLEMVELKAEIFMSNGARLRTDLFTEFHVDPLKIYCIPCGFAQLNLVQRIITYNPDHNIYPIGYAFSIWGLKEKVLFVHDPNSLDPPQPTKMIATKNYQLYNLAPENTKYIAFQNDLGGIETQYFPMWKVQLETEKTVNELQMFDEKDKRLGTRIETVGKQTEKHGLKSLMLLQQEAKVMSKIIKNAVWMIENGGKFERVYADTKSIELIPSHKVHAPFSFAFKRYID